VLPVSVSVAVLTAVLVTGDEVVAVTDGFIGVVKGADGRSKGLGGTPGGRVKGAEDLVTKPAGVCNGNGAVNGMGGLIPPTPPRITYDEGAGDFPGTETEAVEAVCTGAVEDTLLSAEISVTPDVVSFPVDIFVSAAFSTVTAFTESLSDILGAEVLEAFSVFLSSSRGGIFVSII